MTNDDGKKLEELFKDKDFAKKVLLDETPENACELLKEKGVDISIKEMEQMRGQIRDFIEKVKNGEISEEQLKNLQDFSEKVKNGEISEEQLKKMQDGELELEDMEHVAGGLFVETGLLLAFGMTFGLAGVGTGLSCAITFLDW
ncbi:MAG: hypothetical protein K6E34_08590 [Lachnospiraceae bacterium]|nr:hypothetical protein [Lachnospiraceae bacterium]